MKKKKKKKKNKNCFMKKINNIDKFLQVRSRGMKISNRKGKLCFKSYKDIMI